MSLWTLGAGPGTNADSEENLERFLEILKDSDARLSAVPDSEVMGDGTLSEDQIGVTFVQSPEPFGGTVRTTDEANSLFQSFPHVLLYFWAPWCGPCKMMKTTLESMAPRLPGSLLVAPVNVDEATDLVESFDVQSVPTLVFVVSGCPVARRLGAVTKSQILNLVRDHVDVHANQEGEPSGKARQGQ